MQTVPSELMKGSPVRALADGFFRQRRLFAAVFVIVLLPVVVSTLTAKEAVPVRDEVPARKQSQQRGHHRRSQVPRRR